MLLNCSWRGAHLPEKRDLRRLALEAVAEGVSIGARRTATSPPAQPTQTAAPSGAPERQVGGARADGRVGNNPTPEDFRGRAVRWRRGGRGPQRTAVISCGALKMARAASGRCWSRAMRSSSGIVEPADKESHGSDLYGGRDETCTISTEGGSLWTKRATAQNVPGARGAGCVQALAQAHARRGRGAGGRGSKARLVGRPRG